MKKFILVIGTIWLVCFLIITENKYFPAFAQSYFPKSDLIEQVLRNLKKDYVDVERLDPYKMLQAALENLAREIPPIVLKEISGEPFDAFTLQVDKITRKFTIPKLKNLKDLSNVLQVLVIHIKQNLPKTTDFRNIDYVTINGFLSTLDPHTSLLVPEVYTEFREDTGGNYSGVGMYIGVRDEKLQVISPILDSPAYKAGLQAKDNILQIDGESTLNMTTGNASSKIKGPVGTKVQLLIEREEFNTPKIFEIIRARIALKSVQGLELKTPKGRIGYIAISRFHQKTSKEVEEMLDKFQVNLSDFQGFILDLRNNPGGILQEAVKVSDKFLAKGRIVTTAGIADKPKFVYKARRINSITKPPIIVLLNRGSASASEILAAALKQNNRALTIGTQSFGKGSVQQLRNYKDGSALKLTTSKYLTPNNNSLHSVGIVPHIEVNPWIIRDNNVRIINERKSSSSITKDKFAAWGETKVEDAVFSFNYLFDEDFQHNVFTTSEKKEDTAGFDIENIKKNYLLYFAASILQNDEIAGFEELMKSAIRASKTEEVIQNNKLGDSLEDIGVSWEEKSHIPQRLKVNFWVEKKQKKDACAANKKDLIQAGSEVVLCLEIENTSEQESIRLQALSDSPLFLFDRKQFVFGNIPAKASKKWFVSVKIPDDFSRVEVPFTIKLLDVNEKEILTETKFFLIRELPQPNLQYTIEAHGKQDKIEAPHSIKLDIEITNLSKVDSGALRVTLKNGEGKRVFLTSGKESLDSLASKKSEKISFGFDLKAPIPDGEIDLSLVLADSKYKKNISHNFTIPYGAKAPYTITNSAPTIEVANYPLQTQKEEIRLNISSVDDQEIKDIYIFNNDKKEFYQSFSKKKVTQKIPIKLSKELNKIVVFVRDNYGITTPKYIYLYRN
jgi:carboxyl-terminal processing protease